MRRLKDVRWITINTYDRDQPIQTLMVGDSNIVAIEEHAASGEGDKWFYDVIYKDGQIVRHFEIVDACSDGSEGGGE